MGKQSIRWHRECLQNQKLHLAEKEAELIRVTQSLVREIEQIRLDSAEYEVMIEKAVLAGKDGFNRDRVAKAKKA